MSYEELLALPEEAAIEVPFVAPPEYKFFVRRSVAPPDETDPPPGTVVVEVCIDKYVDGKFKSGYRPSVEKTEKGKVLNPLRGWEGD